MAARLARECAVACRQALRRRNDHVQFWHTFRTPRDVRLEPGFVAWRQRQAVLIFRHLNLHRIERRSTLCLFGKRHNLGTFATREAAEKHERAAQFFGG
jgi:hypothetical protein